MSETINDCQLIVTSVNACEPKSNFRSFLKVNNNEFVPLLPSIKKQIRNWRRNEEKKIRESKNL
jgi:hypothetical protein